MLDINFIKNNKQKMIDNINNRNMKCDIDAVIAKYDEFAKVKKEIEEINAQVNALAKTIPAIKDKEEKLVYVEKAKNLKEQAKQKNASLDVLEKEYHDLMLTVPNMMAEDTPIGKNDELNVEIEKFMQPTKFNFKPKDHYTLGMNMDLLDFDAATKVASNKFYYLKNELVQLQIALEMFAMNKLVKKGFTPILTPDMVKTDILLGSGFNPRGSESNIYNLEGLDLNLIATAEITIGGYHSGDTFKKSDLPKKYVGISHCFRREAGASGKTDKGLYRVHQFSKVEMYQFTTEEDGERALQELLGIEKEIYQDLKIPYRVIRICSGDMGAPAYKKYDIEAWMPGRGENGDYGEVTSVGNFTTFQSRRLNIKYIDDDEKKTKRYVNTLNGTAIALTRTILAIMENYQQEDGSILIPDVLKPYLPFDKIAR